jgi:hypothetical protein
MRALELVEDIVWIKVARVDAIQTCRSVPVKSDEALRFSGMLKLAHVVRTRAFNVPSNSHHESSP